MLKDLIEEWVLCFSTHHSPNSSWSLKIWMGEIENIEVVAKLFAGLWMCLILDTCWPKYLGVTCWHFCWHLESLTSWDGLLSPCRYNASAANIVKSHGKSDCNNLRHVVDIHEIHNLLSTQWLSCRIHPTMMVILAEKNNPGNIINFPSRSFWEGDMFTPQKTGSGVS